MDGEPNRYLHEHARPIGMDGTRAETVLLLHGWTGSPAHFRLMATMLTEHGYGVSAPLLAGHGTNVADMIGTGWRDWLRDAATAADEIIATGKRLHIVGLSMGGVLGLLLAPTFGATTLTTINAPQRVHSRRVWFSRLVRGSSRILDEQPPEPYDEEAQPFARQYDDNPVGTVAELFDLVRASTAALTRVTCPTLIIQSRVDETVRADSARIIYDGIAAAEKRIVWLERSRHVALLDGERTTIHRAVLEHLERHRDGPETS